MDSSGILLVEDNPDDALLISRALKAIGVTSTLTVVPDGEEAIAYLAGTGQYSDRRRFPIPQLILLDLELPRINGFEVLSWLRKEPQFRKLPVVVLTATVFSSSIKTAYLLGANSFIVKPAGFSELTASLKQACDAWLSKSPSSVGPQEPGNLRTAA